MLRALVGTALIKEPDGRVCGREARVSHPVEFGFGLLGKRDENGRIQIVRTQTSAGRWQISLLTVHIVGRMLGLKGISRYHDEVRGEIKEIPPGMSLAQAAELTKPGRVRDCKQVKDAGDDFRSISSLFPAEEEAR